MTEFAKTYAGALYALAQEEGLEDAILGQLNGIVEILRGNSDYIRLIDSRNVPKAERVALLDEAFGAKIQPYLLNFMKILCERGAFFQLEACAKAYGAQYDEAHGIVPATAVSARPLDDAQRARLIAALEGRTGKRIRLETRVDPSLIGGMRVQMQGQRFDNTVATRMDRLRRALLSQS